MTWLLKLMREALVLFVLALIDVIATMLRTPQA